MAVNGPTRVISAGPAIPSEPTILPVNVLTSPCAVISCWSAYQRPSSSLIFGRPLDFASSSRAGRRPVISPLIILEPTCALVSPET